jgi:hypothetical protein
MQDVAGEADHDPRHWLASTPLLDLDDPRLRLKARALTQLCKNEREKALAVYGFVKRLPFAKPAKLRLRTAREVMDAGRGDADDKATLFIALLRAAGVPARLRYVELAGEMLRGLVPAMAAANRPLAEIWLGRWVRTDTYIFDAAFMAAARQRLKDHDWPCGYGISVSGHAIWNGNDDAFLGGRPTEGDPMVTRELSVVSDPRQLVASQAWRRSYRALTRGLRWNFVAPTMRRVIRELREEAATPVFEAQRRAS